MVHAKNYDTMSTFVKVMQKKNRVEAPRAVYVWRAHGHVIHRMNEKWISWRYVYSVLYVLIVREMKSRGTRAACVTETNQRAPWLQHGDRQVTVTARWYGGSMAGAYTVCMDSSTVAVYMYFTLHMSDWFCNVQCQSTDRTFNVPPSSSPPDQWRRFAR